MGRVKDWARRRIRPDSLEVDGYRDLSGKGGAKGRAFWRLTMILAFWTALAYIDAAHPFAWDLPGEPWVFGLLGGASAGIYGIERWARLLVRQGSTWAMWPTGKAPVRNVRPIGTPYYPDRQVADKWGLYLELDGGDRYYYAFQDYEVNGTNFIVHFPGKDFVVIPKVVLIHAVPDPSTGELVAKEVDYSVLATSDWILLNGDTTWVRRHKNIPQFMYQSLRDHATWRPDPSIEGKFVGEEASRVDVALYPKWDWWSMQPLHVPSEAKVLSELKSGVTSVAVQGLDAAQRRSARMNRELAGTGLVRPEPQQPAAQRRPVSSFNEEEGY